LQNGRENRGQKAAIYETTYSRVLNELLLLADPEMQAIEKYIRCARVFVYKQDDAVLGVAAVTREDEKTFELKNIAVREDVQGMGIGGMLVTHVKEVFKGNRIIVGTSDAHPRILRFYERCGFTRFHVIKNFFIDNYEQPVIDHGRRSVDMVILEVKERQ